MAATSRRMAIIDELPEHGLHHPVIINWKQIPRISFQPAPRLCALWRRDRVLPTMTTEFHFSGERPGYGIRGVADVTSPRNSSVLSCKCPSSNSLAFQRVRSIATTHRCRVATNAGEPVGVVVDVEGTLGGSRLVVESPKGEVLVPSRGGILLLIVDPAQKRIVIRPPKVCST